MAWTYNPANLATSKPDQVRLLIGDTLSTDQQLQDSEIAWFITQRASVWGAAADACRSLSTQYARLSDTVTGELHTTYSQKSTAYAKRAGEYEAKANARGGAPPYAGGISVQDKISQELDPDRVQPQFQLGMDDNLLPIGPAGNENQQNSGNGG